MSQQHTTLLSPEIYVLGLLSIRAMCVLLFWCTHYEEVWQVWLVSGSVGSQTLPCVEVAICWLAGLGHKAADCRTQEDYAGSLVGRVRVQKTPRLLTTH